MTDTSQAHSVLVDVSLLEGPYEQFIKRQEFQKNLLSNVGAIKTCVIGLKEDIKSFKMKKAATHVVGTGAALKANVIKERFVAKQKEVRNLISVVKTSLDEIGSHLRDEKQMLVLDIKYHKAELADLLGYGDEVRGFDNLIGDDGADQLEIYEEFLGPQEYARVRRNYEKALQTMEMLYQAEIQSLVF